MKKEKEQRKDKQYKLKKGMAIAIGLILMTKYIAIMLLLCWI